MNLVRDMQGMKKGFCRYVGTKGWLRDTMNETLILMEEDTENINLCLGLLARLTTRHPVSHI